MDIFKDHAFAGKIVFVAGGSSGINLGIAQRRRCIGGRTHDLLTVKAVKR